MTSRLRRNAVKYIVCDGNNFRLYRRRRSEHVESNDENVNGVSSSLKIDASELRVVNDERVCHG